NYWLLRGALGDSISVARADLAPLLHRLLDLLREVRLRLTRARGLRRLGGGLAAVGLGLAGLLAAVLDLRDVALRLGHLLAGLLAGLRCAAGARLLARLIDQEIQVAQDAILDELSRLARVVVQGQALARTGHAVADDEDILGDLLGVGLVAREGLLKLLLLDVVLAGFFGELVLVVRLGPKLGLAAGRFLQDF